jgi:hypothetical protein
VIGCGVFGRQSAIFVQVVSRRSLIDTNDLLSPRRRFLMIDSVLFPDMRRLCIPQYQHLSHLSNLLLSAAGRHDAALSNRLWTHIDAVPHARWPSFDQVHMHGVFDHCG